MTRAFESLASRVSANLIDKQLKAFTVTIKIRYDDFETVTRQSKTDEAINKEADLLDVVSDLWQIHGHLDKTIRLLGVSVSNFEDQDYVQIPLLDEF